MTSEWCRECLETAINRYGAPEILNTDQGSQFTSPIFTKFIASYQNLKLSMDGKGRAIDNIFIERFWRNIKYEKLYLEPSENGLELYHKIKDYMKFYNAERPHQSLEYKKPEQIYFLAAQFLDSPNWASQGTNLNQYGNCLRKGSSLENVTVENNKFAFKLDKDSFLNMGIPEKYYDLLMKNIADNNRYLETGQSVKLNLDSLWQEIVKAYKERPDF